MDFRKANGAIVLLALFLVSCIPCRAVTEDASLGFKLFQRGQFAQAFPRLRAARDSRPNDFSINYYYASCAYELGKRSEAVNAFCRFFVMSTPLNQFTPSAEKCFNNIVGPARPYSCKLGNTLIRWSNPNVPVRIYVTEGLELPYGLSGTLLNTRGITRYRPYLRSSSFLKTLPVSQRYKSELHDSACTALSNWQFLIDNKILKYELVDKPENADVIVFWCGSIVEGRQGLTTYPDSKGTSYPLRTTPGDPIIIQLVTADAFSVYKNATHEYGHVWGLQHSHDPNDIMYVRANTTATVSANDMLTVRVLYQLPAEIYLLSPKR